MTYIRLDKLREHYKPLFPESLHARYTVCREVETVYPEQDAEEVAARFPSTYGRPRVEIVASDNVYQDLPPLNVGVLLSGGQAPGGHNVIAGLFDGLKKQHEASRLFGFLMGPGGLLRGDYRELNAEIIARYRNSGGFDMIGSDRTKLETDEQIAQAFRVARSLSLDALVIIGGDDSNTNAAILAEWGKAHGEKLVVVGCPKTIDGDLKNEWIECSFGFDTCVKVYAELIGNIQRDCLSSKKYWHFIRLMGRSASHITLEAALETQPNIAIISEEIEARQLMLDDVVNQIADIVVARSRIGLHFGTALIPEGLVEFMPRMRKLIGELNNFLAHEGHKLAIVRRREMVKYVAGKLSEESSQLLLSLPQEVARQLMLDRDPHGNVQVSRIQTEELLVEMLTKELERRRKQGEYEGQFSAQTHFFGYEGRCSMPTNFDACYCYALGRCAAALAVSKRSGYMAVIRNLIAHPQAWQAGGIPFTLMMSMEERGKGRKPVIRKSLVDLTDAPFSYFRAHRKEWAMGEHYHYPGPIQYFGPSAICDTTTITLRLEHDLAPVETIELPALEAELPKHYGANPFE